MTIAPAGLPIWGRASSMSYYGGNTQKRDYAGVGAINAKTDVSAAQFCRMTADLEEAARMAPLCRILIEIGNVALSSAIDFAAIAWGAPMTVQYDGAVPPAGYPRAAVVSGFLKIGLPASAVDSYGVASDIYPIAGQSGNPLIKWNCVTPALEDWGSGLMLPTLNFSRPASDQTTVITVY